MIFYKLKILQSLAKKVSEKLVSDCAKKGYKTQDVFVISCGDCFEYGLRYYGDSINESLCWRGDFTDTYNYLMRVFNTCN